MVCLEFAALIGAAVLKLRVDRVSFARYPLPMTRSAFLGLFRALDLYFLAFISKLLLLSICKIHGLVASGSLHGYFLVAQVKRSVFAHLICRLSLKLVRGLAF